MASISTSKDGLRTIYFTRADGVRKILYLGRATMKTTETVKLRIEAIVSAAIANVSLDRETAAWLGELDDDFYGKLAAVGIAPPRTQAAQETLGAFLDRFIAERSDVKGSTATVYGHTRRCLVKFFSALKPLGEILPADADDFRRFLGRPAPKGEGLAPNTVNRRCGIARQFFRAAMRRKLIRENPFADMKGIAVKGNRAREFFVSREMADAVLAACPDNQWRLLFALSRFGGLRCPSEQLGLRWGDVDWAKGRLTVHSPKTEHHEGHETRDVPIFPELRTYLEACRQETAVDAEFIITRYRDPAANLRTQLQRIIRKAGLQPWPKLWQNLRSTRQTELSSQFPAHAVCRWLGNSLAIASKHYLQVTDEHFADAAAPTKKPDESACLSSPNSSDDRESTDRRSSEQPAAQLNATVDLGNPSGPRNSETMQKTMQKTMQTGADWDNLGNPGKNRSEVDIKKPQENRDFPGFSENSNGRHRTRTCDFHRVRMVL